MHASHCLTGSQFAFPSLKSSSLTFLSSSLTFRHLKFFSSPQTKVSSTQIVSVERVISSSLLLYKVKFFTKPGNGLFLVRSLSLSVQDYISRSEPRIQRRNLLARANSLRVLSGTMEVVEFDKLELCLVD